MLGAAKNQDGLAAHPKACTAGIFYDYCRHMGQPFQSGNLVVAAQYMAHTDSVDKVGCSGEPLIVGWSLQQYPVVPNRNP